MAKKQVRRRQKPSKRPARKRHTKQPASNSLALVLRDPNGLMPQPSAPIGGLTVTGEPTVNVATIGTLKLTEKQITKLRRRVEDEEVEWRPAKRDGPPEIPYLPHNGFRDRLDAAFGIGGWGMAPVGVPKEKDDIVYAPWALVVAGVPRCYAWGEQAYDPKNRQMTYGDAIEGTKSNAITRCGKELGIARDLWSRRYLAGLKRRVPVNHRVVGDWPAREPADGSRRREDPTPPKATARTGDEDALITLPQRTRLFKIGKDAGRTKSEITTWIKHYLGVTDSGQITRGAYDGIVALVEKPGPLPRKETVREADEILPPITDADIPWGLEPGGRR